MHLQYINRQIHAVMSCTGVISCSRSLSQVICLQIKKNVVEMNKKIGDISNFLIFFLPQNKLCKPPPGVLRHISHFILLIRLNWVCPSSAAVASTTTHLENSMEVRGILKGYNQFVSFFFFPCSTYLFIFPPKLPKRTRRVILPFNKWIRWRASRPPGAERVQMKFSNNNRKTVPNYWLDPSWNTENAVWFPQTAVLL